MTSSGGEPSSSGGFHSVHAERDLESNWAVDLNRLLEEYLAKICAGEIPSEEDDRLIRVNFAEAALLLQGSVQVYSRKVEYLYSLVLHALEFVSQQRQQDQVDGASNQPEEAASREHQNEDDDPFWMSDDVPVDAKNSLDSSTDKDVPSDYFVRPPANLVVLEGDCLDASGDSGELESYLLATHDIFEDFILLDSSDAVVVNDFLKDSKVQNGGHRASSIQKTFQSPRSRSGAGPPTLSAGKNHKINMNQTPDAGSNVQMNNFDIGPDPPACDDFANEECGFDMGNGFSEPGDDSDDGDSHDPWKPLNPHEPGNLKVKPFKKVKGSRKPVPRSARANSIMTQFPLARFKGPVSPELTGIWEKQEAARQKQHDTRSLLLYEKLRQSLITGGYELPNTFGNYDDTNEDFGDDGGFPDFEGSDGEMPENTYMNEDVNLNEKHDLGSSPFNNEGAGGNKDPMSQTSLEDLCRSHLDALLASIAETEKQTELAVQVSTWKQKIEQSLEEQDSHRPFDIHEYGERIVTKLSLEADQGVAMSFADIVHGQEKHDVARSFSALLQLVNNGDVDLDKGKGAGSSVCFTAINPFYVRLCSNARAGESQVRSAKKRVTSSMRRVDRRTKTDKLMIEEPTASPRSKTRPRESPPQPKFTLKIGKGGGIWCTPEGKKRRKSRFVEPINLHSAG